MSDVTREEIGRIECITRQAEILALDARPGGVMREVPATTDAP